jgi:dolichyl-phosphate-mannose--protein O-mannosyl transferase
MAPPITFPPPINPDDLGRGPMIIGLTWSFTGLAVIAVLLRLYIRKKVTHITGWDDWFMLASVVSSFPFPRHLIRYWAQVKINPTNYH